MQEVMEGKTYTNKEIEKLGLIDTHEKFADLHIYKRGNERYLLDPVGKDSFRVFSKYEFQRQ